MSLPLPRPLLNDTAAAIEFGKGAGGVGARAGAPYLENANAGTQPTALLVEKNT